MKKIILILISFIGLNTFYAQGIELPDFVITGVQSVNIPVLPKKSPEPISTITYEFIKPLYSPEDFRISEPSAPIKVDAEIFKTVQPLNGSFMVAAGINTQPIGEAYFYNTFDKVFLYSKVFGKFIRAYEYNSDLSNTGFDFSSKYFIDNESLFLPATKVQVGADYKRIWYKHFMSSNPEFQNKIQMGSANLLIENTYLKEFNFGISIKTEGLFTNSNDYRSMNAIGSGYFSSDFNKIRLSFEGSYLRQYLSKGNKNSYHYDYWTSKLSGKYSPNSNLSFGGGFFIADYDSNSFFSPTAFVQVSLNKNFAIDLNFSPYSKFITLQEFFLENKYLKFGNKDNHYEEYKGNLNISIRFNYLKLIEATLGINMMTIDNKFYFSDKLTKGYFDILQVEKVDAFEIFSNYYFKLGDYGDIFGELVYKNYRMPNDVILPYTPSFTLITNYKYAYNKNLNFTLGVDWKHKTYKDETNAFTLPDYINLNLKCEYILYENLGIVLHFDNILNNKNYLFNDYLEKPLDIYAGINYKW